MTPSLLSFTECNVNISTSEAKTEIYKLSTKHEFDLSHKIKQKFFQAVEECVLLYTCTTWTLL